MTNRLTSARPIRVCAANFRAQARAPRRWAPAAIATFAATVALTAVIAAPQAGAVTARRVHAARPTEMTAPRQAGEPIMAIVSIKSQKVTFYDADGWIYSAPVSSGITGRETPAGLFAVVEKNKDHHSSLYDDAWMPNMLRITWNGIALHGGPLPGYAASHGCVRMPYDFAGKMFDKVPMGMRVIISPTDVEPVAFSDPALLVPNQAAIDAVPERAAKLGGEADEATKAAAAAKAAAVKATRESAALTASLRKLEYLKKRADAALAYADKLLAAAKTDQAKARDEDLKQKAAAKVAELQTQIDAAKANPKLAGALTAQDAAKAAEAKRAAAAKAALDAQLALEPVSIFISRATQKLYVRRDTHKRIPDGGEMYDSSLEFPITIKDPDKPIGTHIFTAVAFAPGGGLRWTEVTIDSGDNAKEALARVTIPKEVLDQIAPTALPRSSITISDEPLSSETNYRTEFVVVLNNQPQGGFLNRARSPDMSIARRDNENGWGNSFFGSLFGGGSEPANARRPGRQPYARQQQPQGWGYNSY
jgi:lipoprotein-anchoring transpeptidase ErfK/SrfK